MDAESKVMSEIESEYQSAINKMYDQRRSEAAKKMDAATAEILGLLSHEYSTMYVDEYRLYRQYRDDIGRWVDENRKNDIAYAETLREEQRQAEKADAVRDDYTKRLEEQAAEFEQRRLRLEEDISRTQARHEEFIHDLETRHEEELTSLRNKNAELQEQFNDLLDRYSSLDATKAQEYDLRLKQAQDEAETERKRAEQAGEQNRITWRMVIILFIVALIAALGIGIIIGMRQNIDYVTDLVAASNVVLPIGV
jgi:chromosome segregation ATPase